MKTKWSKSGSLRDGLGVPHAEAAAIGALVRTRSVTVTEARDLIGPITLSEIGRAA